jgi:hypothetical protein
VIFLTPADPKQHSKRESDAVIHPCVLHLTGMGYLGFRFILFGGQGLSLCSPGWPGIYDVDWASLELRYPPASAS